MRQIKLTWLAFGRTLIQLLTYLLTALLSIAKVCECGECAGDWFVVRATQALEDSGILKNIKRFAGSSAGAICAGLLAVGCTAQEIADLFKCDIKWLFHGM